MKSLTLGIIAALLASPLSIAAPAREVVPQANGAARPEYRANIDDVLEVHVLRPDKIEATVTVGPDGTISFPYIGNVFVKGMSLAGIQKEIKKRLADGYMRYPEVAVTLKESRVNKFFISGEVARPGAYPIEDNTTVLKAISIAGGFNQAGLHGHAKVIRPRKSGSGYEVLRVAIRGVDQASEADGLTLRPGDTVVVSEDKFFAYGELAKPGTYPLQDNTSVLKAISIASGFTKFGAYSRVKVLRPKKDGPGHEVLKVNIRALMNGDPEQSNIVLQPDDTVVVSEDKFFVYGEVNKPGTYPIEEDTTVMKAISIAGGFSKFGSASRVKVLRPKKGGTGYDTIKVNLKSVMEGSDDQDNLLQPGDTVVVSEGVF